jgi:hypothetical protein
MTLYRMKIKSFLSFLFYFMDFQFNFLIQYQKPQFCIVQKFQAKKIQSLLTLSCGGVKGALFYFKHYNLAIYVVDFLETFSTY